MNVPQTKLRFWARVLIELDLETGETKYVWGHTSPAKDVRKIPKIIKDKEIVTKAGEMIEL